MRAHKIYNMNLLKIGDSAPDFAALDAQRNTIKLSDYKGSKLVLFFYPKASTPGCTAQACNLATHHEKFISQGYKILGVSADSPEKQLKFKEKYKLPYPLLADEKKEVIQAFGVWGIKKFMSKTYEGILRTTFLINEDGIITEIIAKVKTKTHAAQILENLK